MIVGSVHASGSFQVAFTPCKKRTEMQSFYVSSRKGPAIQNRQQAISRPPKGAYGAAGALTHMAQAVPSRYTWEIIDRTPNSLYTIVAAPHVLHFI
jgi:hypothetical protein